MDTNTAQAGGFVGDPAEALNPPAASGCCGSPATAAALEQQAVAGTCCGTVAEAQADGSCCGTAAKREAVASGVACCG